MTGAPAETLRKFRFSTAPAWAAVFVLLLCTGFGLLLVFLAIYLVSRRASGHLPLTHASSRRVAMASLIPAALIVASFVLVIAALVVGASTSSSTRQISSSLVYTKWIPDTKATGGPEAGYKPSLTGLTGEHVTSISVINESSGDGWDLDLVFDAAGKDMLAALTRENVAACPGDPSANTGANCSQRSLAIWLGLTQADISNWEDSAYATQVSRQVGAGCVGQACAKLVIDALTIAEIDDGEVVISSFTQQQANDLVAAIQPTSTTSNPLGSAIAWGLGGLAFLAFAGGVVGAVSLRRLIGPRGKVMEQQPGYTDRLVEIRNVHPAFVTAVIAMQQARAASPPPPLAPPLPPGSN